MHAVDVQEHSGVECQAPPVEKVKSGKAKKREKHVPEQEMAPVGIVAGANVNPEQNRQTMLLDKSQQAVMRSSGDVPPKLSTSRAIGNLNPKAASFRRPRFCFNCGSLQQLSYDCRKPDRKICPRCETVGKTAVTCQCPSRTLQLQNVNTGRP